MKARGPWQGMMAIVRFNWPLYVSAGVVLSAVLIGSLVLPAGAPRLLCWVGLGVGAYFVIASLAVSHLIYDRSDLYRWRWLDRALRGVSMHRAVFCHCGFDESSAELRVRFGDVEWELLDHFDSRHMTEGSIRRARAMFPPSVGTRSSPYQAWAVATDSADVVFALLAIHELRSEEERSAWFAESHRCLRKGGRVVLAEHVRNLPNLLGFGPGCLHFHASASWRRCWESAGFHAIDRFRVTPFIHVFILTKA